MSYRFFGTLVNDSLTLHSDDIFHLTKVLRVTKDELIEVVCDDKIFFTTVKSFNPFTLEVKDTKVLKLDDMGKITLLYALPKGDKLELVIQKSVELGVSEIILVDTERSIGKLKKDKLDAKLSRFEKIIKSAAMQSKRNYLPKVIGPLSFKEALELDFSLKLFAHEKAVLPLAKVLRERKELPKTISLFVGPEGGFSEEEVKKAVASNYLSINFGATILRSETAPLYGLSVLNNYKEGLKT